MIEKLIQIGNYQISYEEDTSSLLGLSNSQIEQFQELLFQARKDPKKTYKEALEWQAKHPGIPSVDNLVTYLHLRNKRIKKAEKEILNSYLRYPEYLFAKINYADQCLRSKNWKEISTIFPSFDLHELFPKRRFFHVAEFRGFMLVAANYFLKKGDRSLAQEYYNLASLADPDHPSVLWFKTKISKRNPLSILLHKIVDLVRIS